MRLHSTLNRLHLKTALVPTIIAVAVVLIGAYIGVQQNRQVFQQQQKADVTSELALVRSRIESVININVQLTRGVASNIASEPTMMQRRFSMLARHLISSDNQLRSIAASPALVVTMVHPRAGNDGVMGLNLNTHPEQKQAALRAKKTGKMVLAGPMALVEGGQGFVIRVPVTVNYAGGRSAFWGLVNGVIDARQLYKSAGLYQLSHLDISIRGTDGAVDEEEAFFGPEDLFAEDIVTAEIILPDGSWQIGARPRGGWQTIPPNEWLFYLFSAIGVILVGLPIFTAGWLVGEREDNLDQLEDSQAQLTRLSRRLELALTASNIGVWENNLSKSELYWDTATRDLFGFTHDRAVIHEDWVKSVHPEDLKYAEAAFERALETTGNFESEYRIVLEDGTVRHVHSMGRVVKDDGEIRRIVGINHDITRQVKLNKQLRRAMLLAKKRAKEIEAAKAEIEFNALHCSLTGLPNRRYLDEIVAQKHELCLDARQSHGVLHIDLDRFKQINDTLGHAAGDAMLVHAGKILAQSVREGDFVARIGGDEFVVLCPADASRAFLETLAGEIVEKMRQPVNFQGHEVRFGVSIGIACGDSAPDNPHQLMINADIALYRAKREGRGRYHYFTNDLHHAAVMTKKLADEIMTGIENDQFIAYYQGQFDAETHRICGAEALIRWKHPEKGLLPPAAFIDVAEELNVMGELDRIVLEQALAQQKRWQKAGIDVPTISVNVSARRLHDRELGDHLRGLDIAPGSITFELVESIFLDNGSDVLAWNIDQLKELGIGIEIDDFGTGYTSILSLMRVRPDRLKIDRQLVTPITSSPAQRDLVRSIVNIGKSLGIDALAEGVEDMEQAQILRDIGCTALQGFGFHRPMSGTGFTRFARSYSPKPRKADHKVA